MKIQKKSGFLSALGLLAIFTLSSCSRGYGCPYDFSIFDSLSPVIAFSIEIFNIIF